MSSNYRAYVGPYLKIQRIQVDQTATRRECSKCGTVYTNGSNFCSKDGAEVVQKVFTSTSMVNSYYGLFNQYPDLAKSDMCDAFYTPEYLHNDTYFICKPNNRNLGFDVSDKSMWIDMTPEVIKLCVDNFKSKYALELQKLSDLGINYEIVFGILGYWS